MQALESSVLVVPTASDVSARQQMFESAAASAEQVQHEGQNRIPIIEFSCRNSTTGTLAAQALPVLFFGHTSATSRPPQRFVFRSKTFFISAIPGSHFSVEFVQAAVFRGPKSEKAAAVCKCGWPYSSQ